LEQLDVDLEMMKIIIRETVNVYNNDRPHISCLMKTYKKENSYQENLIAI